MPVNPKTSAQQPHRIAHVTLHSQSFVTAATEIEIERHKAISDLLYENSFALQTKKEAKGPYHLTLSLQEDRLIFHVDCTATGHQEEIGISLNLFRKHIQDYTILCDSFYKTARLGHIHKLEALDAGRRSIHDESAEILAETIENKVILDKSTARRLFSLIYVLHMRSATNLMR